MYNIDFQLLLSTLQGFGGVLLLFKVIKLSMIFILSLKRKPLFCLHAVLSPRSS